MLSPASSQRPTPSLPSRVQALGVNPVLTDAHLQSIIDTLPDAMILIDEHGLIISFSRTAEKVFGYLEEEVIGENVSILMPSPNREQHDAYLARYLATGERRIIGIRRAIIARRRDGSTFPADLSIGEATVGGKSIFTGFLHNLSEGNETQRQLHMLQGELADFARVSQLGTLATAIAHEINQPLAAIVNYLEAAAVLLADGEQPDLRPIREAVDLCADEAIRAGEIIRRLRESATNGQTEKAVINLRSAIETSVALVLAGTITTGLSVDIQINEKAEEVFADRVQVQQVLVNLIRNAIEAMKDIPSRMIDIIARPSDDAMVEVIVSDSGPGLDGTIVQHLFQPFATTKAEGLGHGLSICHAIIEGHGGRIWADRSHFAGMAFHFTIQRPVGSSEKLS